MADYDFSYAKRGPIVRLAYLCFAVLYFGYSRLMAGDRPRAVVLCYHAVMPAQRHRFEAQMSRIAKVAIGMEDLERSDFGPDAVAITFDDAFECLLETALPITKQLGVPISIYAVTGNMGRAPDWAMDGDRLDSRALIMTNAQLRDVDREAHCLVGSHTVNHRKLAEIDPNEVLAELRDSKETLETLLDHPIEYLALPHGSYNEDVLSAALDMGYRKVLTLNEICVSPDNHHIPLGTHGRFSASPEMWMIEFILTAKGAYAWLYPWRRFIARARKTLKG